MGILWAIRAYRKSLHHISSLSIINYGKGARITNSGIFKRSDLLADIKDLNLKSDIYTGIGFNDCQFPSPQNSNGWFSSKRVARENKFIDLIYSSSSAKMVFKIDRNGFFPNPTSLQELLKK